MAKIKIGTGPVHVVVVDDELDVQVLGHSEPGSLGVVALHL